MTRILIAEDSPTQAEQLRLILESEGFEVEAAPDAQMALELFERGHFDMVISDIVMPGMSGYELCASIKRHPTKRDVPVILLSTLNDPMDIIRGLECEADNFITKPYEPDQLVARIRTVLQNREIRSHGKLSFGVEVVFLGKKFIIGSEKEQILDLLISTFEDIVRTNRGLLESKAELAAAKEEIENYALELEQRVQERTAELVERQQQLVQAQKMEAVGQLTGGLAHDFNNLLTIIISNLDLLEEQLTDRPDALNFVRSAVGASLRGAELTKQLLAFSRRQLLQSQVINLNQLTASTTGLLRRTLGEEIEIVTALSEDLWPAEADPAQVESALVNLAINARDAMPEGGKLIVETSNKHLDADYAARNADVTAGDYVLLAVSDTGSGIPGDILPRVFDPFFTTKGAGKGTGLGLSMIYGFAKQSGGHVKIYSEEGRGTTVRLYLPRAQRREAIGRTSVSSEGGPLTGNGERLLVVEDNSEVRAAVVRQLTDLGYRVLQAENGANALKILESGETIDMMFSDIVMPGGMSGLDLGRRAREIRPSLAILYTTGFSEASVQGNGALEQGCAVLSKPYRKQDLARKIRDVLASAPR